MKTTILLIFSFFSCFTAIAQLRLPVVIGNNMVLQRGQKVPIWGWATAGELISVQFGNHKLTCVAGVDSFWRVDIPKLKECTLPQNMIITYGEKSLVLENILVGDVWICSGQSNMEYPLRKGKYAGPAKGVDTAALDLKVKHPNIRVMKVERKLTLPDATSTGWHECEGDGFENSSVVGFYFAKHLSADTKVPVGVITSAWNGSRIEPWTPPDAYKAVAAFREETTSDGFKIDDVAPGKYFQSMIAPLSPFAISGFLWYQGESNCMIEERDMRYAYKMQALIESWRSQWGDMKLPFYYVLIAPYYYTHRDDKKTHTDETLPLFWEQQIAVSKMPNVDFVSVTDLVDNLKDIHPSYKWEVGRRLSLLARAKKYREKSISCYGPEYKKMQVDGNKLMLRFENAEGLKTLDGNAPDFFTIAGADGRFYTADAVIDGEKIILACEHVKSPVKARFAWTESARPNLVNGAGLPATPFRTDATDWVYKPSAK